MVFQQIRGQHLSKGLYSVVTFWCTIYCLHVVSSWVLTKHRGEFRQKHPVYCPSIFVLSTRLFKSLFHPSRSTTRGRRFDSISILAGTDQTTIYSPRSSIFEVEVELWHYPMLYISSADLWEKTSWLPCDRYRPWRCRDASVISLKVSASCPDG